MDATDMLRAAMDQRCYCCDGDTQRAGWCSLAQIAPGVVGLSTTVIALCPDCASAVARAVQTLGESHGGPFGNAPGGGVPESVARAHGLLAVPGKAER